ncbi:MAG: hypothetical protein V1863_00340 [Candidatus Omnitrophota bacterium]
MSYQHQELAKGRWFEFSLVEQLANVGSEVERTINWRNKGNHQYSRLAFERALELLSLTIDDPKNKARLKEPTRLYELLVDYFAGDNLYASSDKLWRNYFLAFAYAARLGHSS